MNLAYKKILGKFTVFSAQRVGLFVPCFLPGGWGVRIIRNVSPNDPIIFHVEGSVHQPAPPQFELVKLAKKLA